VPTANSPSLSNLQQWMRWVLTHPHGVRAALTKPHALKHCLKVIGETPDVDRATRLSIYGNGYFWRIIEAVGSTFSSVRNVIGADEFHDLARAYLVKYPSRFKSIDDIGGHLAVFLKKTALIKRFPFLSDLAAVEWAAHQAFFADDEPAFQPKRFKNIQPDTWLQATLRLHGSVRLLRTDWPVNELWREDGQWASQKIRRFKKARHFYLIHRNATDKFVRMPEITSAQFQLLTSLYAGRTLRRALSKLPASVDKSGALQTWFQAWFEDGIVSDIRLKPR
jgi:hypothetical protein